MTEAALFDWDGTLLDSRDALLGAWHAATGTVLGTRFPATAEEEELVFTMPGVQLFPRVGGDAERGAALAAAFREAYARTGEEVRAFPGVADMLRELRDAGVAIAVVTSKARGRYDLDAGRAGLAGLVDVAVCSEDTEAHKPDPAPVLHAPDALGVAGGRAGMTGDTPVDIAAGAGAGATALGVAWGASGAQPLLDAGASAIAHDAAELTGLLLQRDRRDAP